MDAVMQNIKDRWPSVKILGLSMNPEDTQRRHQIPAFPISRKTWDLGSKVTVATTGTGFRDWAKSAIKKHRYLVRVLRIPHSIVRGTVALVQELSFLVKAFRRLRSLDVLVIAGGGQLTDWFGTWRFPYTLFVWSLLARLASTKCIFLNVGAGPLSRPLSKFFIKRALLSAEYISFRDAESQSLVRKLGFKRHTEVSADCVYGLQLSKTESTVIRPEEAPRVGIAPMPYYDPHSIYPEKSQNAYDRYIEALSKFGNSLLETGHLLTLFGTDIGIDPPIVQHLESAMIKGKAFSDGRVATPSISNMEELLAAMSLMDYVVTCRFHGIIFAHKLNIPVLAISHHPKMDMLMSDLGLSKYCLDIRTFDAVSLGQRFASLCDDREKVKTRMAATVRQFQHQLALQFDTLFPRDLTMMPVRITMRPTMELIND